MIGSLTALAAEGSTPGLEATPAAGAFSLMWVIIALPLLGALLLLAFGRRLDRIGHWLGVATVAGSFAVALWLFFQLKDRPDDARAVSQQLWSWIPVGDFQADVALLLDPLSMVFVLLITGVASWRIMISVVLGTVAATTLLNTIGSDTNPLFEIPFWWHFVIGGLAFATVFIATEPVTAAHTQKGQYIYGFLIGVMVIVVRVLNPAYPDGILVAILLMNLFAPLIDHYVVRAHVKKRRARYAA